MTGNINGSVEDFREDIPLRKSGSKVSPLRDCFTCKKTECLNGLGLVYTSFGILSVAVTFILMTQIYYGAHQVTPYGNVATDYGECSVIGINVLRKGGNAVDAGIAATICMAVVNPHTTGLAAGGVLMRYNHRSRLRPDVIDFGPIAKLDTTQLPRLIIGLAYAHEQFGKLPWKALIKPSVDLARNGFLVPSTLATAIKLSNAFELYGTPQPGQSLQLQTLAYSLELYSNLTSFEFGSYINSNNQPITSESNHTTFGIYNIYSPNNPNIGSILLSVLDNIEKYNLTEVDTQKPEFTYRLAEMVLDTYDHMDISKRLYEVTASVVTATDMDDTYVSIVTGLNGMLGSHQMNPAGYINDNLPAHNDDHMETTFMPVILTNSKFVCGKRVIFGAGDVSLAAQIISNIVLKELSIDEVIESPRFRILGERDIGIEENFHPNFTNDVLNYLQSIGNLTSLSEPYDGINVVQIVGDKAEVHSDSRTGGTPSQF